VPHKDPEVRRRYRREYMRRWRAENPGLQTARLYGVSVELLWGLLHAQGHRCAICRKPFGDKTPHVDHDHKTHKVRGLLCVRCNVGLGHVEHDRGKWVRKAMKYLATRRA
jgi:hypothetical protein